LGVERIVVLTGAGVSAESGVPTFRGPDGLWEGERVEDVATPEAFRRDPAKVQRFYDARRAALGRVEPNAAHRALARLDAEWPGDFLLVTQNVDDLHERAGSTRLIHVHGELRSAWCLACDARVPAPDTLLDAPACPACALGGHLRPDIVWFGEMPYRMDAIDAALMRADLFVSIGTSGNVYPAAGFVDLARHAGARCIELNLDPSMTSHRFHESRLGPAGTLVPALVESLLESR
jgi:NAD-dependent deacetylase